MSSETWADRLFGGFRKTSERLGENLAGIVTRTRLDDAQLDAIEDALILSDLGPPTSGSNAGSTTRRSARRSRRRSRRSCVRSPGRSRSSPFRARR